MRETAEVIYRVNSLVGPGGRPESRVARRDDGPYLRPAASGCWEESRGEFTPVYVNESLTVDFADREQFQRYHLCFRVSDADFDAIFGRIQSAGLGYRSRPRGENDMLINRRLGGKNVYWEDGDGHLWEILTVSYARAESPVAV